MFEEIRRIDRETAPHGLYGLREAHQTDPAVLPSLSRILIGLPFDLIRKVGGTSPHADRRREGIQFQLGARQIELTVRAEATTKIRKFGNRYVLDPRTEVSHLEVTGLADQLARLGKDARDRKWGGRRRGALLAIGHFPKRAEAEADVRDALAPAFLARWQFRHAGAIWEDIHDRKFWTSLQLWAVQEST